MITLCYLYSILVIFKTFGVYDPLEQIISRPMLNVITILKVLKLNLCQFIFNLRMPEVIHIFF